MFLAQDLFYVFDLYLSCGECALKAWHYADLPVSQWQVPLCVDKRALMSQNLTLCSSVYEGY